MKAGIIVPQGWTGEYDGWDPRRAWERTVDTAVRAEECGFESVWAIDHFHTIPQPSEEITFESFVTLAHLGAATTRVRLGHLVMSAGFRNPALTAKMISTMDTQTGGRMELGIGAGWKQDEWEAYGYGFPSVRDRLAALRDQLEIFTAMMGPGRATYAGEHWSVDGAINVPKPLQQPRVPIVVGGNGPEVTWRLAARFADELNLDGMTPEDAEAALPVVRERCAEIGRDPASLPVSAHIFRSRLGAPGQERIERLSAYRELGISRIMTFMTAAAADLDAVDEFAADCREAGLDLVTEPGTSS